MIRKRIDAVQRRLDRYLEPPARLLHAIHGTRGILAASVLLLLWLVVEPNVTPGVAPWVVAPLALMLLGGIVTLPREGVAVQQRARRLIDHDAPVRVLQRRGLWLALLLFLLLPRVFLALYGIPHLSPAAGLLAPQTIQSIAAAHVAAVIAVCAAYVRSSRRETDIPVRRPIELRDGSGQHLAREGLQVATLLLLATWLWALHAFWSPFGMLDWPPDDAALRSARAAATIAITVAPPALLLCALAGHIEHVGVLVAMGLPRERRGELVWSIALAAGVIVAAWLHLHNLLWVARFQQAGVL